MPADALASKVASASADMALAVQNSQHVLLFQRNDAVWRATLGKHTCTLTDLCEIWIFVVVVFLLLLFCNRVFELKYINWIKTNVIKISSLFMFTFYNVLRLNHELWIDKLSKVFTDICLSLSDKSNWMNLLPRVDLWFHECRLDFRKSGYTNKADVKTASGSGLIKQDHEYSFREFAHRDAPDIINIASHFQSLKTESCIGILLLTKSLVYMLPFRSIHFA